MELEHVNETWVVLDREVLRWCLRQVEIGEEAERVYRYVTTAAGHALIEAHTAADIDPAVFTRCLDGSRPAFLHFADAGRYPGELRGVEKFLDVLELASEAEVAVDDQQDGHQQQDDHAGEEPAAHRTASR